MLHAVRHSSGKGDDVLRYLNELFEIWRSALDLPDMDREVFMGRALLDAPRYVLRDSLGLALDPIWLAAVVCAAAKLDLTHGQLLMLRSTIEKTNADIKRRVAEALSDV